MGLDVEKSMSEINFQFHQFMAIQCDDSQLNGLGEHDIMILEVLSHHGQMSINRIAKTFPYISKSTVSTAITKLCHERGLVSKRIDSQNQRTRLVELTDKGKKAIDILYQKRAEKFRILLETIQMTGEERQILLRIITRAKVFLQQASLS